VVAGAHIGNDSQYRSCTSPRTRPSLLLSEGVTIEISPHGRSGHLTACARHFVVPNRWITAKGGQLQ
jgi:hypothetical protein